MSAHRRRNPGWLRWLWGEVSGEHTMQTLRETRARRDAQAQRQRAHRREYIPIYEAQKPRRQVKTRQYKVVVKDTHVARTRPYQEVRKTDEFADLVKRAETGEMKGDELRDFINKYQVTRRRK